MGRAASAGAESEPELNVSKCKGAQLALPTHSYWFDFWVFVLVDVVILFVIYFLVP